MRSPFVFGVVLLGLLAGCSIRGRQTVPAQLGFTDEVRRVLRSEQPSRRFYRDRERLAGMGAELDAVLVVLAEDVDADLPVRRNALALLGERGNPIALPVIRRVLLRDPDERVRAAAVSALQRAGVAGADARNAIRAAVGDPARQVRLTALQALNTEDVDIVRSLLSWETDDEVNTIAKQLVALAESRGAPLVPDRQGGYRTTAGAGEPRLVFRPISRDTVAGIAVGPLLLETTGTKFVPLADSVEVVGGVLPAFFAPDRTFVVWETKRQIQVLDLKTGRARSLGPGIAPRVLPFTDRVVWVREQPGKRRAHGAGTEIRYDVWSAAFVSGEPVRLGELRAIARPELHGNASPVRWMVVGELPEGFALRGPSITTFMLPNPFDVSPPGGSALPPP